MPYSINATEALTVIRLMPFPAQRILPLSLPLGSGSSRQQSASLQQRTQGRVRPPRRATEGSLSRYRSRTIQRTGQLSLTLLRMALA